MKLYSCLIAFFLGLLGSLGAAEEGDYLTYHEFITEVEAGSVKSATLDRYSRINGTHVVNGVDRLFKTYGDVGTTNDILLTRLLNQKKVAITLNQKERSGFLDGAGMFSGLLIFLVPIITLVFAIKINSKLNRLGK
jgi:ATP-dependent Zn protease